MVGPNRDRLDACLCFPSMPAVMKLNKLGTFSMAQLGQSKSIIGDFIKSARKVCVLACRLNSAFYQPILHTLIQSVWPVLAVRHA